MWFLFISTYGVSILPIGFNLFCLVILTFRPASNQIKQGWLKTSCMDFAKWLLVLTYVGTNLYNWLDKWIKSEISFSMFIW